MDCATGDDGAEVDLGTVRLRYRRAGVDGGPRVLAVSGSGSDLRQPPTTFDSPLPAVADVVGYDHRGLGRSTTGPTPPTMADFAADLLGLLDHLGWDTCRMIGISFGGMVAMEAAVTAPERFERVVLACTSAGGAGGASYPLHELPALDPADRLARRVAIMDTRTAKAEGLRRAFTAYLESAGDTPPTAGELAQLEARRHHDVWDRLPALTMPVLLAAGRYDGIAPPANQQAMADRLPHADLRWYDGGHGFFVQDPTAYPEMAAWITA